ncbi:MAG TPA: hypothetical protein VFG30_23680 [Polyangiales bacterium]|nr:hypothetical protein [Polyangiales bacterium]
MLTRGNGSSHLSFWLSAFALAACSDSTTDAPGLGTAGTGLAGTSAVAGAGPAPAGSTSVGNAGRAATSGTTGSIAGSGTTSPTGAGGTGVTPAPAGAGAVATAGMPATGGMAAPMPMPGAINTAGYKDPGKGPWMMATPDECKMDPAMFDDTGIATYAVYRYGKLCHIKGGDATGMMYSATKTLGGVMAGRAAYVAKDVAKTGPGTGPIVMEDLGTDWIASPSYPRRDATISHVMSMVAAASSSLEDSALTWRYDTIGSEAINNMINATEKCIKQVPGMPTSAPMFVKQEIFDKLGMGNSSWGGGAIATGWSANLSDMGKLATLLLHDGFYGGEQLVSRDWVYRMSHPNFENANTSYGALSWLNHRGGAEGIGGNISTGANAPEGDPCAPAAFWPKYPHFLSKATDCLATKGPEVCKQMHDIGVFSAQGLNGQFLVMHPGLDIAIVARNFSGGDGPLGLWRAIRPGVVAKDPMFKGDETAFCAAYGAGNYAPDLVNPRVAPTM